MKTLDFEPLTFNQLNQLAEKESEIFEKLARLLREASESEKLYIAAIAVIEAQTFSKPPNLTQRLQSTITTFPIRNVSPTVREASRLIDALPFSDGALQLAQFIIEKMRDNGETEGDIEITEAETDSYHQNITGSDGIDTIPF